MIWCIFKCRVICRVPLKVVALPAFHSIHWMETLAAFCLPVHGFVQKPQSAESFQRVGARWRAESGTRCRSLAAAATHAWRQFQFSVILLEEQRETRVQTLFPVHRRRFQFSQLHLELVLWIAEIFILVSLTFVFTCPAKLFWFF